MKTLEEKTHEEKKILKPKFSSQRPFIPFCTGDSISAGGFSPTLIGCISNHNLWLFSRQTGRLVFKTKKEDGHFVRIFFDPSNQDFLYTMTPDIIRVLDTKTNTFLGCKIDKKVSLSDDVAISPKGTYLVCRKTDLDSDRLWFKEAKTLKPVNDYLIPGFADSFAIDPNEKILAAADYQGYVFLFEIKCHGYSYPKKIKVSDRRVSYLTFSRDSKKILFESGAEVGVLDILAEAVCFSKKPVDRRGSLIWAGFGSSENEILMVTAQGEFVALDRENETVSFINSASFSRFHIINNCLLCEKNHQLIIGTALGHIEIFDIRRREPISVPWSGAFFLEFLNNGAQTVIGSIDGDPVLWDFQKGIAKRLNVQTKGKWRFCWLKKQKVLIVASSFGVDFYGFKPFKTSVPIFRKQLPLLIQGIVNGKDGEFLIFSGFPQTISVFDCEGNTLREKKTKTEEFQTVHLNPKGDIHIIDSRGTFSKRYYDTLEIIERIQHKYYFHLVTFLGTETAVAFVPTRDSKVIEVFSLPAFKKVGVLSGHENEISEMAASNCGTWLASVDMYGAIFVWEKKKGELKFLCTAVHQSNGMPFERLKFSMDGKTLAAVGLGGVEFFRRYKSGWKKVKCKYPINVEPIS